jgi:acyl-CoA synthetase (AMP-forming)/AMP-acid ligase II
MPSGFAAIWPGCSTPPGPRAKPKGVRITHGMMAATSLCYPVDVDPVAAGGCRPLRRADEPWGRHLRADPCAHGRGAYRAGLRRVRGGEVLDLSEAHGATSMFMAPTMVRRLTDAAKAAGRRGEGIKTIVYGGGPMYRADIEEAVDWFGPASCRSTGRANAPWRSPRSAGRRWRTAPSALGGASGFRRARAVAGGGRDLGRGGRGRCPPARPARSWCAARR